MPVQDVRGRTFDAPFPAQRIASLVPSITETLFAFGAGPRVVAITDYCIHPQEELAGRKRVGGTKNPRVSDLLALAPDLVLANVEENRRQDVAALEARGIPVFVTGARTVRGAIDELHDLARLLGSREALRLVEPIEKAYESMTRRQPGRRPRVFVAIWRDPWMTANRDTYIGDLIDVSGGENVFAARERRFPLAADLGRRESVTQEGHDTRYPRVSMEEIAAAKPETVLLPSEPYPFGPAGAAELHAVGGLEQALIHLVDGTLISWYGVRTGRALQAVNTLLRARE